MATITAYFPVRKRRRSDAPVGKVAKARTVVVSSTRGTATPTDVACSPALDAGIVRDEAIVVRVPEAVVDKATETRIERTLRGMAARMSARRGTAAFELPFSETDISALLQAAAQQAALGYVPIRHLVHPDGSRCRIPHDKNAEHPCTCVATEGEKPQDPWGVLCDDNCLNRCALAWQASNEPRH